MSSLPPCRRLVVGTDFSPSAAAALRLATAWAVPRRLELRLVHAVPPGLGAQTVDALLHALGELADEARSANDGIRCEVELFRGPATELLGESSEPGDWLVLGVDGSSAGTLRRAGRLAEAACRNDSCVVLLAPPRWRAPERGRRAKPPSFQRVLVGLSGGPKDRSLLEAALELAAPDRPEAAHVMDLAWSRHYPAAARMEPAKVAERETNGFLDAFLVLEDELVDVAGETAEISLHVVPQGPVHADLAGLAEALSAELLIVGSGPTAALTCAVTSRPMLVLPELEPPR